jgi:hypothetical protein
MTFALVLVDGCVPFKWLFSLNTCSSLDSRIYRMNRCANHAAACKTGQGWDIGY